MSEFDDESAFGAALSLSQRAMAQSAMAPRSTSYLEGLNPAQREAVEALDGPVLMLAGAGTGKTKALTCRIAHLLNTGRAQPGEILAVTFTNKAAREMRLRIGGLLGEAVEGMPWLGTFHSVCVKLLRRHAELAGLKSNFTILDTDDQVRLLKQLILAEGIDEKRWPARQLAGLIDAWKNRALTPDRVPSAEAAGYNHRGTELYEAYQERLKTLNATDFGDRAEDVLERRLQRQVLRRGVERDPLARLPAAVAPPAIAPPPKWPAAVRSGPPVPIARPSSASKSKSRALKLGVAALAMLEARISFRRFRRRRCFVRVSASPPLR